MVDAALVYRRGVEAFNSNDLVSARAHFEAATLAAPIAWEPLLSLAHVHVRAGEVFAAAESMDAAVARLSASAAERTTMDAFCSAARPLLPVLPQGRAVDICNSPSAQYDFPGPPSTPVPLEESRAAAAAPLHLTDHACSSSAGQLEARHLVCAAESSATPFDTEAAALLSASTFGEGVCVCASLHEGTNADLEDWLAQYRCSTRGGSSRRPHSGAHVVLYDDRRLSGVEWEAASWSLEPWVESGWLTWKHTAPEPHDKRAQGSSQHEHLHATSPSASDARRPPGQARRVACHEQLARHPGCNWMAMIEAPYESLVHGSSSEIPQRDHGSSSEIPQRDHGSSSEIPQRDHGSSSEHRGACEQSRAPPVSTTSIPSQDVEPDAGASASASPSARGECPAAAGETSRSRLPGDGTMRVGVVRFGLGGSRPSRGSQLEVELPVRPLPVVSDRREATWGRCIRTDGTLCASLDETAVLIRLTGTHESTAGADDNHNRTHESTAGADDHHNRTHESTAGADDNHNRTLDPYGTLHHRTKDETSRRRGANSAVPPLLWPPTALGALRVHRYTGRAWGDHSSGRGDGRRTGHVGHGGKDGRGGPSGATSHRAASHSASQRLFGLVVDPFGREAFEACLATGTPSYDRDDARSGSDDALAFGSWAAAASEAVTHGDGLAMFRGALSRAEASLLREDLLSAIPPAKRTTRVFANHMCQVRSPLISLGCP